MKDAETTLRDRLAAVAVAMGYEFVGFEWHKQSGSSVLRIYIDKETGVTMDDCAKMSRQASAMLDVEDPIQGRYTLEVSSPGLNRPLFELAHYQKFIGSNVRVRVHAPLGDRRNFVGVLLRVEEENICLLVDTQEIVLPFSNIDKAKVIAEV
jgi:ribosome maturation factor RimP